MNNKDKIIFLISNLEQPIGGAQIHVMTLINIILNKLGKTEVYLITGEIDQKIYKKLSESNVKIIEEKSLNNKSSSNLYTILKSIFRISNLFNSINPKLISIHSSKAGFLGRIAALVSFKVNRVIFTEHGWPFDALKSFKFFIIFCIQILVSPICKYIICTSDTLAKKLNYKKNKLILYNTIRKEYKHFERSEEINKKEIFKLGMVARLSYQKDIKRFISIAEKMKDKKYQFYLAGDGPLRKEIEYILKLKNLKNFTYLGQIDLSSPNFYKDLDCFVLLSFYEGLPRSILEGMSQSCPIIVSDVGSNKDVFSEGKVGLLVKQKTTDKDIVDFIKKISKDNLLYKNLSSNSFNTFKTKYAFDAFEKRYLDLYDEFFKN